VHHIDEILEDIHIFYCARIPHLSGLGEKYKGHGVTVVGVTREKDHDVSIFLLILLDEFA